MCIDFPANDINNFLVGAEDGCVYQGCRHGQKAGVVDNAFEGHFGPVTGTACHPVVNGPLDFSHLFLTSSFDWTVKLWSCKVKRKICLKKRKFFLIYIKYVFLNRNKNLCALSRTIQIM